MSEEAEAEILAEIANVAQDMSNADVADPVLNNIETEKMLSDENFDDPGTPLGDEYQPAEDSEEEDDIQITIGDIRSNVTTFRPQGTGVPRGAVVGGTGAGGGKQTQKLDLDSTADINGTSIYDLDLATLEEKPWRKPGADLTDYFNYGFTEETWLIYCDRQKKLRSEYGMGANKVLFSSIVSTLGGVNTSNLSSNMSLQMDRMNHQKMAYQSQQNQAANNRLGELPIIMRTCLVPMNDSLTSKQQAMVLTPAVPTPANQFSMPPPDMMKEPPQNVSLQTMPKSVPTLTSSVPMSHALLQNIQQQAASHLNSSPPVSPGGTPPLDDEFGAMNMPPAMDHALAPPSVSGPPTIMTPSVMTSSSNVDVSAPPPTVAIPPPGPGAEPSSLPFPDMSVPPPRFPRTNLPPPGFGPPPPGMPNVPGMPPTNVPPPMFPPGSMPPGIPVRFPPPFGFPPPVGPRAPPPFTRDAFVGFNPAGREDARSPASYSDKSSDEESSRRDRYEGRGGRHTSHGNFRHSMSRGGPRGDGGPPGYGRERERSSFRASRHRSRSKERGQSKYRDDRRRQSRERSEYRERSKHRRADEEEKPKKHKVKEEIIDDEEPPEKVPKKSKERSERKERSSGKKKRKKDRRDEDDDDEDV